MWNNDDPLERAVAEDGRRETRRANQSFRDYALMGAARSLEKLQESYTRQSPEVHQIPVTKSIDTLKLWSRSFSWVVRAARFDEIQQAKVVSEYEAYWRGKIMCSDEILGRLSEQARVNISEFVVKKIDALLDKDGQPTGETVESFSPNWEAINKNGHLIKSITSTANGPRIEMYDGQAALINMGRHHKLFTDQQNVSGIIEHEGSAKDNERYDRAVSTLADAIREILPGASTKPDGPLGPSQ